MENYNFIWESKGIILGIINFILTNIDKYKKIFINHKKFAKIIKKIFPHIKVSTNIDYNTKKSNLIILVRTNEIVNGSLVINNIDNIKKIKTKKSNFYLLPWFDTDNPIIMFKFDENQKEKNILKLKKKITLFHKIYRSKHFIYHDLPLNSYKCDYIFWDIVTEFKILSLYANFYNLDVNVINNYLCENVNSFNCQQKCMSHVVPLYIHEDKKHNNGNNQFLGKFVSLIGKKMDALNNILISNMK